MRRGHTLLCARQHRYEADEETEASIDADEDLVLQTAVYTGVIEEHEHSAGHCHHDEHC